MQRDKDTTTGSSTPASSTPASSTPASSTPASSTSASPFGTFISCATCCAGDARICRDCLVTYVEAVEAPIGLTFSDDEWRAIGLLADAGMVPSLRHREAA